MSTGKQVVLTCLLLAVAIYGTTSQNPVPQYYSDYRLSANYKQGLTFQATVWPTEQNSFVGRMSCNGCDPQNGDTSCS